jgi:hypothetical protein
VKTPSGRKRFQVAGFREARSFGLEVFFCRDLTLLWSRADRIFTRLFNRLYAIGFKVSNC